MKEDYEKMATRIMINALEGVKAQIRKAYDKGYKDGKAEYEDKQKHNAEIKVGDEVYSDAFDDKGIVTHITTDKVSCVCIICNGFTMMKVGLCGLHKTGRHFDQIAEVLAELRGAENDE